MIILGDELPFELRLELFLYFGLLARLTTRLGGSHLVAQLGLFPACHDAA